MGPESIINYKRPGYPRITEGANGIQTVIEYIGPTSQIEDGKPAIGDEWGDYTGNVSSISIEPVEGAEYSVLIVTVEFQYEQVEDEGILIDESYEIDWQMFQRPMLEHPAFRDEGEYALESDDVIAIEAWKNEPSSVLRGLFQFSAIQISGSKTTDELSSNAKKFAEGILLGQETYEDYAPVARKTSIYVKGPPPESDAGLKDDPTGFPNLPSNYEWRKIGDSSIRASRKTRWDRTEEWIGAIKILSDKEEIFW